MGYYSTRHTLKV